jgi:hypothetical protein
MDSALGKPILLPKVVETDRIRGLRVWERIRVGIQGGYGEFDNDRCRFLCGGWSLGIARANQYHPQDRCGKSEQAQISLEHRGDDSTFRLNYTRIRIFPSNDFTISIVQYQGIDLNPKDAFPHQPGWNLPRRNIPLQRDRGIPLQSDVNPSLGIKKSSSRYIETNSQKHVIGHGFLYDLSRN